MACGTAGRSGGQQLSQFQSQAETLGQQARALTVLGAERARRAGEADVVQRAAERQAVLAHQPDPLAAGPGQLGGPGAGRFELATQDVTEQPHRAVKVADVMLDQVEARLGGPGSASSRGGGDVGGEPCCWATWITMP